MVRIILFSLCLLSIISCGANLGETQDLDVRITDTSSGEIILLDRQVTPKNCLLDGTLRTSYYNRYKLPFADFKYPSSIIKKVFLAGTKEIYKSRVGSRSGVGVNDYGKPFIPCFGFDYSNYNSYQSAAVDALYSFSLIESNKSLLPQGMPKLSLRVATNIKHIVETSEDGVLKREVKNLINNAFYTYKDKEVTYVPKGSPHIGISPFASTAMWKIPFVGVHEYGHHLFAYLVPNYVNDKLSKLHSTLCFDRGNDHFRKSKKRKTQFYDVMKAFNEGVADLFSRQILDKKITLKGIGCLEKTREVDSKYFSNDIPKKMTQSVFRQFLIPQNKESRNCMRTINFNDPHMVGAIIAHSFHKIFDKVKLEKEERLSFLYRYLRLVNREYPRLRALEPQSALEKIIYLGLQSIDNMAILSQKDKCGLVSRYFPTLHHYYSCK